MVDSQNAKVFMESIVEKCVKFNKVEKGHDLSLLKMNMVYDGVSDICEHIIKLVYYHNKLKSMNANMGENFLI